MKDIKFFSVIILAVLCLGAANGQMMPATQRASLTANDTDKHVVSIVMNVYCDALWQLLRKTRAPKRVKEQKFALSGKNDIIKYVKCIRNE